MKPIIEEIFLKCLGSKERLIQYINQDINLAEYVQSKYGFYLNLALMFLRNRPYIINQLKSITKEDILDLLKRRRPDLYQVLQTKKGKEWLKKQDFSKFFNKGVL